MITVVIDQADDTLPAGVAPADVAVSVLNGSGVGGQAKVVFDALQGAGFSVAGSPGNADRNDYDVTEVRYVKGSDDLAKYTKAYL